MWRRTRRLVMKRDVAGYRGQVEPQSKDFNLQNSRGLLSCLWHRRLALFPYLFSTLLLLFPQYEVSGALPFAAFDKAPPAAHRSSTFQRNWWMRKIRITERVSRLFSKAVVVTVGASCDQHLSWGVPLQQLPFSLRKTRYGVGFSKAGSTEIACLGILSTIS